MIPRKIVFWHGRDSKLESKIAKFCSLSEDGEYYWHGTLDGFETAYCQNVTADAKFIIYPFEICITHRNSFSQC